MATRTTKSTTKTTRSTTRKPRATSTTTKTTTKSPTSTATAKTPKTTTTSKTTVVVDAPTPVVAGPMMRKKELVDAVVARSGMKKKDVKPAVEATLAVLGDALKEGRTLNLQPLGKVKINREKALASGRMMVARIRQRDPQSAEAAEAPKADAAPDTAAE